MVLATPRVDPRVRRTRQQLLQAFLELMHERAFQDITVQDIAERADVNRATFYAHFSGKHALMDSVMRAQVRQMLAGAIADDAPVSRGNLQVLTRSVLEYLGGVRQTQCQPNDLREIEPLIEVAMQEELHAFVSAWLQRLPKPTSPPELPLELAATLMSGAIFGAAMRWSRGAREVSADTVAWQVVAALLKGLPGALGIGARLP